MTSLSSRPHTAGPVVLRIPVDGDPPGARVLSLSGVLDRSVAARLLRVVDAQLALARTGVRALRHLVLDLDAVSAVDRAGLAGLRHVRYACDRLGVRVHLAGAETHRPGDSVAVRAELAAFLRYPTVDVALRALDDR